MNRDELQVALKVPQSVSVDRVIPKVSLYKGLRSPKEKQIVKENINKVIWLASFKPNNTNISPFKNEYENYSEIELIFVDIKDLKASQKIFEVISKLIPYPLILIFQRNDSYQIFTGQYKLKKDDFLKLDDTVKTAVISLNVLKDFFDVDGYDLNSINLKQFYLSFEDRILKLAISKSKQLKENVDYSVILDLQNQIKQLTDQARKESQLNLKVDLMKKIEVKQNKLDNFYRR